MLRLMSRVIRLKLKDKKKMFNKKLKLLVSKLMPTLKIPILSMLVGRGNARFGDMVAAGVAIWVIWTKWLIVGKIIK